MRTRARSEAKTGRVRRPFWIKVQAAVLGLSRFAARKMKVLRWASSRSSSCAGASFTIAVPECFRWSCVRANGVLG